MPVTLNVKLDRNDLAMLVHAVLSASFSLTMEEKRNTLSREDVQKYRSKYSNLIKKLSQQDI